MKPVPRCEGCQHCVKKPTFTGGKIRFWCAHRIFQWRALHMKWISSKERGKNSPRWCPLRGGGKP